MLWLVYMCYYVLELFFFTHSRSLFEFSLTTRNDQYIEKKIGKHFKMDIKMIKNDKNLTRQFKMSFYFILFISIV